MHFAIELIPIPGIAIPHHLLPFFSMSNSGHKRSADGGDKYTSHFHKKFKNNEANVPAARNDNTTSSDPLERFYSALVRCRSMVSSVDKKKMVCKVPDLLSKLLGESRAVGVGKVDLSQFTSALNELRGFQVRAVQSESSILRYAIDPIEITHYYRINGL